MTKRQFLLVNMTKGWCLPLKGGSDGLLAAEMERLLLGDVHELLTIRQVNEFRTNRGKLGRCPVRLLTPMPQPKTRLTNLSLETFAEIMSHLSDAHVLGKLTTLVALAMSCQSLYEKLRPLLRAALDAASRWEGDELVILGPRSEFHLLPQQVQRWCITPGLLFIVDDCPKRMVQAAQIIFAIKSNGLLSRKAVYRAAMDAQVFVRNFLLDDTPYRPYETSQFRAKPPIDKRALARIWLELTSAQQATFDHADARERFLCNYATNEFIRQSAFQNDFLSLTRAHTVSSNLGLGDIVALLIACSAKSKDLDFSSSNGIDIWNGPWAGDAFVFRSKEAQLAGCKDVSDAITDFLLEVRAGDIMITARNDDAEASICTSDTDNAHEPECNDDSEGDLAGEENATPPTTVSPLPTICVTAPVGDARQ